MSESLVNSMGILGEWARWFLLKLVRRTSSEDSMLLLLLSINDEKKKIWDRAISNLIVASAERKAWASIIPRVFSLFLSEWNYGRLSFQRIRLDILVEVFAFYWLVNHVQLMTYNICSSNLLQHIRKTLRSERQINGKSSLKSVSLSFREDKCAWSNCVSSTKNSVRINNDSYRTYCSNASKTHQWNIILAESLIDLCQWALK